MERGALRSLLLVSMLALTGCEKPPQAVAPPTAETGSGPTVEVSLESPSCLNGMTQAAVFSRRRRGVNEELTLFQKMHPRQTYEPSQDVFGRVEDGKPWWSFAGLCFFGPGESAIEGDSRESLAVNNPYALVLFTEVHAHIVDVRHRQPEIIYPFPSKLTWSRAATYGWLTYDKMEDYFKRGADIGYPEGKERKVGLNLYNARDLGYNFVAPDTERSPGVVFLEPLRRGFAINQYLARGGSCGCPGGCNNICPNSDELVIQVPKIPAHIFFKLWRDKPEDFGGKPDCWFVLDLKA